MRYDLVIFDLDGTLLDTLGDLAYAVNRALEEAGYPTHSVETIRQFIGNGASQLIRRSLPESADGAVVENMIGRFKALYVENINRTTLPFPGIVSLLDALKERGMKAAVNSNKPDVATGLLCRHHFGDRFAMVLGETAGIPRKPAPDGALRIMKAVGATPERTLYVGDGDADIMTAKNAGIDCAWVKWGYRRREELAGLDIPNAFDSVEALRAFILND